MTDGFIHNAPCVCFQFNDTGILTYVNEELCSELGYTPADLIGNNIDLIFPVATKIFYSTHFFPLLKLSSAANEIFMFLKTSKDEQLPLLINARRIATGEPQNLCSGIVVHNRKKFEEELINARNKMQEAIQQNSDLIRAKAELDDYSRKLDASLTSLSSQNEELKQFNKVVTHDLQEPIRKLFFYSDVLKDQVEFNAEQTQTFAKIVDASERLRHVLSGLQEYVWITENIIHEQVVELNALLSEVILKLAKTHQKHTYEVTFSELPTIRGDLAMLRRLFYFILENSIRFSKPGIKNIITINALVLKKNIFTAITNRYEYEDFLKVTIADKGTGFDPVFKSEAFNLFKKLHNSEGRGLGLTLSRKIMNMHDGFIEAESQTDEGTQISLFFPIQRVLQGQKTT